MTTLRFRVAEWLRDRLLDHEPEHGGDAGFYLRDADELLELIRRHDAETPAPVPPEPDPPPLITACPHVSSEEEPGA